MLLVQEAGFLAAGLALLFGVIILFVRPDARFNRILGTLLVMEALFQVGFAAADFFPETPWEMGAIGVSFVAAGLMCATYVYLLERLDTPLAEPLRRPMVRLGIPGVFVASSIALALLVFPRTLVGSEPPEDLTLLVPIMVNLVGFVLLSAYAFVVAISAWLRAPPGAARERASAFALAFGIRDILFALGIAVNFSSDALPVAFRDGAVNASNVLAVASTMLYVPILAYGILRTQLFDIDLKVKLTISRGTVASIFLVTVFVLAKVVESYLNRTAGFVAGSAVAGALLFLVPKLNKVGDKVANTAMPQVQPTPVYVQFKKLEVYRAAVESAQETGGLDERQRATLDRLRTKLGLASTDCAAIEAEIVTGAAAAGS